MKEREKSIRMLKAYAPAHAGGRMWQVDPSHLGSTGDVWNNRSPAGRCPWL